MVKFSIGTFYKNPQWSGQTSVELEHLESLIDVRRRQCQEPSYSRHSKKFDPRIVINVSGARFETLESTLERYPNTLLGNIHRRSLFYDHEHKEYFFDRHRLCFEAILYYYQSKGRLRRPENVPLDTFLEEISFFQLGYDALMQVRKDEDLEEATKVQLPKNRFCRHVWANLEFPQYSMTAKIIYIFSAVFILLSAVGLAVETLPYYRGAYGDHCEQQGDGLGIEKNSTSIHRLCPFNFHSPFFIIQSICVVFFTIEFILRFISCPSYLDFVKSILNWIDFLAIVPYFITLAIILGSHKQISQIAYSYLTLLPIFRFMRVFKIYRIFQHIKPLRVLVSTLKESIPNFIIVLSFLTTSGFLFGAAIYFVEKDVKKPVFSSIPDATYYGIITLTAVGYGDLAPQTALGRALACLAAVYGISIVSMLVSILVGRYQRVYNRKRFFKDDYSEKRIFRDSLMQSKSQDECAEIPTNIEKAFSPVPESDDEAEENDEQRSAKVHFALGCISDDDDDDNPKNKGDYNDELINKVAQKLSRIK